MRSTSRHLSQCQKRQVTHNTGARVFTVTSARHTGRVHPVGHQSLLACHRLWIWAFPRDSTASSNLTSFRGTQSHMVETATRVSCPAGRSIFHAPPRPDACLRPGRGLHGPSNFAAVWYFVMALATLAVPLDFLPRQAGHSVPLHQLDLARVPRAILQQVVRGTTPEAS